MSNYYIIVDFINKEWFRPNSVKIGEMHNRDSERMLMEFMLINNHRSIAFIGDESNCNYWDLRETYRDRTQDILNNLKEKGLIRIDKRFKPNRIIWLE